MFLNQEELISPMNRKTLISKYVAFFESKDHKKIDSAPLIPEHDPTVLFTTAGMHPLVPFLMGQPHPLGRRLVNVQKCIRTQDIDEVGDKTHTTFFEMLGNWSLGDYFKKEAIEWSYEFLTSKEWLNLDKKRIAVTCFKGDDDAPKDEEAAAIWKSLGVPNERIAFLEKEDNWWGPAGQTGPCGPDTEMFYWTPNDIPAPEKYDPEDKRWVEIWNDVFMQYNKTPEGKFIPLEKMNVDTGLGVERVTMILQGKQNIFEIEVLKPLIEKVAQISGTQPNDENLKSFRIIADHMRAATFILGDERGVPPSNVDQGYILRRYIRRALRHLRLLGVDLSQQNTTDELAEVVIELFKEDYPILNEKKTFILDELKKEEDKFAATLDKGLKIAEQMFTNKKPIAKEKFTKLMMHENHVEILKKLWDKQAKKQPYNISEAEISEKEIDKATITGEEGFLLFQSYGFPKEMIIELATEKCLLFHRGEFKREVQKHQELSRKGAEQRFKGGLSEASDVTKKLHTATHLLGEALRKVLGDENIKQKGSNITPERLRYDFNFDRKLTKEEIQAVEEEVNRLIEEGLPVSNEEMKLQEALDSGAQAEFGTRYPEKVSVYHIGEYSKEICMGPHVENTKELGNFKIKKEESSSAGVRRIKAVLT